MSQKLLKNQIYSGLLEILKDDKLYYKSIVGNNYCKFTEDGKDALIEYMTMMAPYILEKEKQEMEKFVKERAKSDLQLIPKPKNGL